MEFVQLPTVINVQEDFAAACVLLDHPTQKHRMGRSSRTGSRKATGSLRQINRRARSDCARVNPANNAKGGYETFCAIGNRLSSNTKRSCAQGLRISVCKRNAWPLTLSAIDRNNLTFSNRGAAAVVGQHHIFLADLKNNIPTGKTKL
jgi:hypothetical protein